MDGAKGLEMPRLKDLTGLTFTRITVLSHSHVINKRHYWNCQCSCGIKKKIRGSHLIARKILSCGCYAKDAASQAKKTHGRSGTKIYKTWTEIIARCTNPNSTIYDHYGGRGITMCDRWRYSFENFLLDMGEIPFIGAEIDRIDNNGNYDPSNCRWVTRKQNVNNRSNTLHIEHNGITRTLMEWSEVIGIKYKTLHRRIRMQHMNIDDAFKIIDRAGQSTVDRQSIFFPQTCHP
jgi:hypothetical protein